MRLFSKEYFTRKTIPRKRTKPPIQAKSLTPKNASQSIGFATRGTGGGGGGLTGGNGGGTLGTTLGGAGSGTTGGGATGGGTARGMVGPGGGETACDTGALGGVGTGAAGATTPRSRDSSAPMRLPSSRTVFFSFWISTTPTTIRTIGSNKTTRPRQMDGSI